MYTQLALDALLTVLFLVALAHKFSGNTVHEWVGLIVFACLVVHNVLNVRWYRTVVFVYTKSMPWRWVVSTVCTLMLVAVCVGLLISSVLHSQHLFTFLPIQQTLETRQWHTLTAYWCVVLAAVHAGMHWPRMRMGARSLYAISGGGIKGSKRVGRLCVLVLRALAVLIVLYGVWFSYDRQLGAKLMGLASFDYWDFEQNATGFFIGYACVMGLWVYVGYCIIHCFQRK